MKAFTKAWLALLLIVAVFLAFSACGAPNAPESEGSTPEGHDPVEDPSGKDSTSDGTPDGDDPAAPLTAIADGYYFYTATVNEEGKLCEYGYRFHGDRFDIIDAGVSTATGTYELAADGRTITWFFDDTDVYGTEGITDSILIYDRYITKVGAYVNVNYYRIDPNVDHTDAVIDGYYTLGPADGTYSSGYVFDGGVAYYIVGGTVFSEEEYRLVGNWIFKGNSNGIPFSVEDGTLTIGADEWTPTDFPPVDFPGGEEIDIVSYLDGRYYEKENGDRKVGFLFDGNKIHGLWDREVVSSATYTISGHFIFVTPLDDNLGTTDSTDSLFGVGDGYIIIQGTILYLTALN